jgi:hypothetical protein
MSKSVPKNASPSVLQAAVDVDGSASPAQQIDDDTSRTETPLDFLFQADRAEKARAGSISQQNLHSDGHINGIIPSIENFHVSGTGYPPPNMNQTPFQHLQYPSSDYERGGSMPPSHLYQQPFYPPPPFTDMHNQSPYRHQSQLSHPSQASLSAGRPPYHLRQASFENGVFNLDLESGGDSDGFQSARQGSPLSRRSFTPTGAVPQYGQSQQHLSPHQQVPPHSAPPMQGQGQGRGRGRNGRGGGSGPNHRRAPSGPSSLSNSPSQNRGQQGYASATSGDESHGRQNQRQSHGKGQRERTEIDNSQSPARKKENRNQGAKNPRSHQKATQNIAAQPQKILLRHAHSAPSGVPQLNDHEATQPVNEDSEGTIDPATTKKDSAKSKDAKKKPQSGIKKDKAEFDKEAEDIKKHENELKTQMLKDLLWKGVPIGSSEKAI